MWTNFPITDAMFSQQHNSDVEYIDTERSAYCYTFLVSVYCATLPRKMEKREICNSCQSK